MAVRELSVCRVALKSDDAARACDSAHRASIDVLLVGQTGANQGQLESSTEFHLQRWFCVSGTGRGRQAPMLKHLLGEGSRPGGSLAPLELLAD
jgi:hypothetical protein